jgi:ferrous iron transport protein A
MQVSELQVGQSARIISLLAGESGYGHKLMAMGLIPGTCFEVIRRAPLGDPIEILVRGSYLGLRQQEAAILQVEVC